MSSKSVFVVLWSLTLTFLLGDGVAVLDVSAIEGCVGAASSDGC